MQTNQLPRYDDSDNTTGCCPRFNPEGWDGQILQFRDKKFVTATTRSALHIPLNMDKVFTRVHQHIEGAGGYDPDDIIVLSHDLSPWKGEHLFAVPRNIPNERMTTLSGDFLTRVFEGPYRKARDWLDEMRSAVRNQGHDPGEVYFFYTTCPKCAKVYGRNYVVGVAEMKTAA